MVEMTMLVKIKYPKQYKYTETQNIHRAVEQVLNENVMLLAESYEEGTDMIPAEVEVLHPDHFTNAYAYEAQYLYEESGRFDEDDPAPVALTQEDYYDIGYGVVENDWLNEQISEVVWDAINEKVREKLEDSDNNEV